MSEIHLSDLLASARDDLRERWTDYRDDFGPRQDEPHDVIYEIADGSVPVYTHRLLQLAADNPELATVTPELGPAFDGAPTPVNIIAANLFETIEAELWEEWGRIEAEAELAAAKLNAPEPQSIAADSAWAAILADAEREGREHGVAASGWLIDGNTTDHTARRFLQGIQDGDPEVLDMLPASPLSGEWAGGLTPRDVLGLYDMDQADDGADDVLTAFENGYAQGVSDEVKRSAREIVGDDEDAGDAS